jgi:hypothetical protein
VRRGPWKWISAPHRKGGVALFNIVEDPSEKNNLLAEHPAIATSLEKDFTDWNKTLADPKWVTLYSEKSGD